MKKILSIFFALSLLCINALAENTLILDSSNQSGETTIEYTIKACKEYTVKIPPAISLDTNNTSNLVVSLDATKYQLEPENTGVYFSVTLSTDQEGFKHPNFDEFIYYLVDNTGTHKIGYTIENEDNELIPANHVILDKHYTDIGTVSATTLTLTAYPLETELPGKYTDTLTFSVMHDEF